jgi:Zn-dependent protease
MINRKELVTILVATLVLGFTASLLQSIPILLYSILSVFIILLINILAKKITAYYLESKIEIQPWEISRYGFKPKSYFRKPLPAWLIFPLVLAVVSGGYVIWLASLVFEPKPLPHRSAKRHGLYSFSEMSEYDIGLIAAAGIGANLLFVIVGYLIHLPAEMNFVVLSIWFTFFNMLPISSLDGNKILFGSKILWSVLAIIVLIAVTYTFTII